MEVIQNGIQSHCIVWSNSCSIVLWRALCYRARPSYYFKSQFVCTNGPNCAHLYAFRKRLSFHSGVPVTIGACRSDIALLQKTAVFDFFRYERTSIFIVGCSSTQETVDGGVVSG